MVAPLGQRWMRTSRGQVTRYVAAVETSEGGGDYGDVMVVIVMWDLTSPFWEF